MSSPLLKELRQCSTCVIASAIETFGVRLRNTGFTDSSVRCMFPALPPIAGYAVTARIRSMDPPMEGRSYYLRNDWWSGVLAVPAPRIVVVEDLDEPPGRGAFVGEVHANILQALGCTAFVTNGAIRDVDRIRTMDFQVFAGDVSVSHAYAHVFDFGGTVQVGKLKVQPGDLLHGDLHGIQTIPTDIASQVPGVAQQILKARLKLIGVCHSADFSLEKLQEAVLQVDAWFEHGKDKKT
jgi:regulator of RNase E activity RraA